MTTPGEDQASAIDVGDGDVRTRPALLTGGPGVKAPLDRAAFLGGFRSLDLPPPLGLGWRSFGAFTFLNFLRRFLSHESCNENYESLRVTYPDTGQ